MNTMRLMVAAFIFLFTITACEQTRTTRAENLTEKGDENEERDKIRRKQYVVQGRKLYATHCANCHKEDGTGLGRLIPPLKNSDYLQTDVSRTICLIKYGQKGEIVVNGITYNQPMPGQEDLTDLEIAEIVTYVYFTWGKDEQRLLYGVQEVSKILAACKNESANGENEVVKQ